MRGANLALGNANPFGYRGYYYDTETKLYYLQTRYYDPETGRFLNMDSIDYANPENLNGLNLYAYCNNNPVMYVDPTGHTWVKAVYNFFKTQFIDPTKNWIHENIVEPIVEFWQENKDVIIGAGLLIAGIAVGIATLGAGGAVGAITGLVLGGVFGGLSAYHSGDNVFAGVINGALIGATGGSSPISSVLVASGLSILSDRRKGKEFNSKTLLRAAINGVVAGGLSAGGKAFGNLMLDGSTEMYMSVTSNFISSFIFSGYSFVSDVLIGMIKELN